MSASLAPLEQLLRLSEGMLRAAQSGDWASLASHEAERRALAECLPVDLTSALAPALQERARTLIENCQHCDQTLQPLVAVRLNELRVVLRAAGPLP